MAADKRHREVEEVLRLITKKATFEKGVKTLSGIVDTAAAGEAALGEAERQEVLSAVHRVAALLKARYTAPGFWTSGRSLFLKALPLAVNDAPAEQKLSGHLKAADDILGELTEAPSSDFRAAPSRSTPAYQFEGQLSLSEPPPRAPPHVLEAEALLLRSLVQAAAMNPGTGNIEELDGLPSLPSLSSLVEGHAQSGHEQNRLAREGHEEEAEEEPEGEGEGRPAPSQNGDVPPAVSLEGMLASLLGPAFVPGLEEAIEASLEQGSQQVGAPPASKKVVEKLPTFQVGKEHVSGISRGNAPGDASFCTVCQEAWKEGDSVREMPCSHRFHVDCLQPWLDQRNSCPMCRHEIPTDDHVYENRKEREKDAEIERKGAQNAVKEGAYMYL